MLGLNVKPPSPDLKMLDVAVIFTEHELPAEPASPCLAAVKLNFCLYTTPSTVTLISNEPLSLILVVLFSIVKFITL